MGEFLLVKLNGAYRHQRMTTGASALWAIKLVKLTPHIQTFCTQTYCPSFRKKISEINGADNFAVGTAVTLTSEAIIFVPNRYSQLCHCFYEGNVYKWRKVLIQILLDLTIFTFLLCQVHTNKIALSFGLNLS